jgi:2-(1,2-epoxy-1,2-dihydrophenyl)acetyl-CoA isomerase
MLQIEDRGRVRWLTMDRPERKNAIPPRGWELLRDEFAGFEASAARVLVVRGAGEDFCSGADLADRDDTPRTARTAYEGMKRLSECATALHRLTKPTIAAVDGVAVGAGMNLALGCDVVIASTRARFSEIFVRRGLTLDFGGTWQLPRHVGLQRAKELALSGRMVGAEEAVRIGLALEAVEPEVFEERVTELAETFATQAPLGQMFAKQGIDVAHESSFAEALDREGQAQTICFGSSDSTEGIVSFLEKRTPDFQGR